jgi:hypothetical protein
MQEIKFLIKHSKYILPILTLISLCKISFLFLLFNIEIGSFVTFDELLNPLINDMLFYLVFFVVPFFLIAIFLKDTIGKSNLEYYLKVKEKSFLGRLYYDLKQNLFLFITLIIGGVILVIKNVATEIIVGTFLFVPILNFTFWLRREIMIKQEFKPSSENLALYNLSTLLITVFLITMSNTLVERFRIKNYKSSVISLELTDKHLFFGDSIKYIGRTKNYTFLYLTKSRSSVIIDNSQIKSINSK